MFYSQEFLKAKFASSSTMLKVTVYQEWKYKL